MIRRPHMQLTARIIANVGRSLGGVKANRTGKSFESMIIASAQNSPLSLSSLPKCGGRFVARGKMINDPMPCDFIGAIRGTGRAVYFDAKAVGEPLTSLRCDDPKIVKPHQKAFLQRMAAAGAIAGLLVRSERAARYLWLPAEHISGAVKWDAAVWVDCGPTSAPVRFENLIEKE